MTTQQIINWLETRCKNNIEIHGTDKWNRDMEDLLELLKDGYETTPNNMSVEELLVE